jgi:tetratricopeptide (TPR) repeat protein
MVGAIFSGPTQEQCIQKIIKVRKQGLHKNLNSFSRKCVMTYPKSAKLQRLRGLILFEGKKYSGAAVAFRRSLKMDPKLNDVYPMLLRTMLQLKAPEEKVFGLLEKIRSRFAHSSDALVYTGDVLQESGMLKTAFEYYAHLILGNYPNEWIYHLKVGQLYCLVKNWQKAKSHLEQSIKLKPDFGITLFYLGKVWEKLKNEKMAHSFFQHALKANISPEMKKYIEGRKASE